MAATGRPPLGGLMDQWMLVAREEIRDLVARYNAKGDTGRFDEVIALFAPDAVMELLDGQVYSGHDEIRSIFTGARDRSARPAGPTYLRHMTATHQIDLVDQTSARGRCYYQVLTAIGL